MHTRSIVQTPSLALASGVTIPDSKLAREATELVRDTENSLLFNHSSRVYYFAAVTGKRKGLTFDPELLYVSAMFHDMGLTREHSSATDRFEVDGANVAVSFFVSTKSPNMTSTRCGLQLPFTRRPVSRSTCIR
jgi:HD superfamily phosphodiesterase